jgi:hypothetical protein
MNSIIKISCALIIVLLFHLLVATAKNYTAVNQSTISDSTTKECTGEIESKKGKTLKVNLNDDSILPEVGVKGTLSKYFEEEVLGMYTHGYIDIAEVEVKEVGIGVIYFTINKELTNIKINGKKENLFKKGVIVKFVW